MDDWGWEHVAHWSEHLAYSADPSARAEAGTPPQLPAALTVADGIAGKRARGPIGEFGVWLNGIGHRAALGRVGKHASLDRVIGNARRRQPVLSRTRRVGVSYRPLVVARLRPGRAPPYSLALARSRPARRRRWPFGGDRAQRRRQRKGGPSRQSCRAASARWFPARCARRRGQTRWPGRHVSRATVGFLATSLPTAAGSPPSTPASRLRLSPSRLAMPGRRLD